MMKEAIEKLAVKLATDTVKELENIKECYTRETLKYGIIKGHYRNDGNIIGEFVFFSKGKELFRSTDRNKTIVWLAKQYFNID